MGNLDRNLTLLLHIKGYCKEALETLDLIKHNFDQFEKSFIIKNSLCMDLLQIGELVNRLDTAYLEKTKNQINLNAIRGMRNRLAHEYLKIDYNIVFSIVEKEIPELNNFLESEINKKYDFMENINNADDEEGEDSEI